MKGASYNLIKRCFDFSLSLFLLIAAIFPLLIISIFIKLSSEGPIIYWSDRIGLDGNLFKMPKFRTMYIGTPAVATHLLKDVKGSVTPLGKVLRRFSIDEFPQIFSILKGQMSFVGPRPALFNQHDLIKLRKEFRIETLVPGLTGWAQINGRDNISIQEKVEFDKEYKDMKSLKLDFKIIFLTILRVFYSKNISH